MLNQGLLTSFACGILLGLLLSYAFWTKIRVIGLKADLAKICIDTDELASRMGRSDNPDYLRFRRKLLGMIHRADMISVPVTFYVFLKTTAHSAELEEETDTILSIDPEFASVLTGARRRVSNRIAGYLARETFCGWFLLLMIKAFPSLTRDEIEQGASTLINPQEMIRYA